MTQRSKLQELAGSDQVRSGTLLSVQALRIGHGRRPLFGPFDLSFEPGDFWCLLGRNGAGKTTLLRTLLGLLPPLEGQVLRRDGLRLAYLPQRTRFDELYPMSARDVCAMGAERGVSFLSRQSQLTRNEIDRALERFELTSLRDRRYRDLSEGQKQRVLLARAVLARAELAFFDEPTSAMDQPAEEHAFEALRSLAQHERLCIVLVTHDLGLARRHADRALFIDDLKGELVSGSIAEVLRSPGFLARYGLAERAEEGA